MDTPRRVRITSLDFLRGLVMIIMALDHVRDFIHYDAFLHDPLDLSTTSPLLFLTRWITHFCAPVFVFLAGTSIYLQGLRKTRAELGMLLFTRGLWLIFVELVIITFAWTFNVTFSALIMQVIWAIGISMFLMGAIIRLPYMAILILGAVIVAGHNVLDGIESTNSGFWWDLLQNGSFAMHEFAGANLVIVYPFLPWLGVMMLGYCFGALYKPSVEPAVRKRRLMYWGTGLILFFVALRFTNLYGDPVPWATQATPLFTLMSFVNTYKYPPSLLFLCMTIGPSILFLAAVERFDNTVTRWVSVFGRVPFLYYVVHLYLIHFISMMLFLSRGHSLSEQTPDIFGIPFKFLIVGEGYSLTITYLIWIGVVVGLYPVCKWFCDVKQRKRSLWLSYL